MIGKSGIYKILNIVNGKFYIGSAIDLHRRFRKHRSELNRNCHENAHLQNAWNKYGADSFTFLEIECCEIEQLIEREQFYLDNEKPVYNIAPNAKNCLGIKHTDEAKRHMSESRIGARNHNYGRSLSEETRKRISESKKGTTLTEEHKLKLSKASRRLKPTEEMRKHLSELNKGERNPRYGKPGTMLGKHPTEEARSRMSESKQGERNNRFGTKHTEETIKKMSEARSRHWAIRKAQAQQTQPTLPFVERS